MTTTLRSIEQIIAPEPVIEGAGVRVLRSIGTPARSELDPFLLLDHFDSKDPQDYQAGFPLHPHRGIETVTYVLAGRVRHKDTLGNEGVITAGDVQWMSAGHGILHEEMPQVRPEGITGFQLWVNLPAKLKMSPPRYQNISSTDIPELTRDDGARIRVIAGTIDNVTGPVTGIAANPLFLDVTIKPHTTAQFPIRPADHAFSYVFAGSAQFASDAVTVSHPQLVSWGDGEMIQAATAEEAVRFLLVAGHPLNEPIVRHGPFVMNTRAEIEQTLRELREGTFAKA